MIDISFSGGSVTVSCGGISTTITEFSDEGSPIECQDIEVTGHSATLNGQAIFWRKPSLYQVSVTVIPGSDNDAALQQMLRRAHMHPGNIANISELEATMTIRAPQINASGSQAGGNSWNFSYGRILSGPTGPSSNGEGKTSARTYTFIFERMNMSITGRSVNA